jgi:hypothetical protein
MPTLEQRIKKIEERNLRVEADKAWETSWYRRIIIASLTYIVVVLYLLAIDNDSPYVNSLVPVLGYLLSTIALHKLKDNWVRKRG